MEELRNLLAVRMARKSLGVNGLEGFNPKNLGTFFTLGYRIF